MKLKVLIYYSIVKLQGDKFARRILDLKDVNLALVGVVYAVLYTIKSDINEKRY